MAERRLIVDHLKLTYEGLFDVTELYQVIDTWLRERGFDKRDVRQREHATKDAKYIEMELQPWKKITDYARHVIKMELKMSGIKDVEVEMNSHKTRLNRGKVSIIFDGYLDTDYEHKWEQKPMLFVLRTIFDKWIYKSYMSNWESELVESVNQLYSTIKGFLNLYSYKSQIAQGR